MNISELETYLNNHDKVIRAVFPWSTPDEGMTENRSINQFVFKVYWTPDGISANDPALVAIVKDWGGASEKVFIKGGLSFLREENEVAPFKDRVQTVVDNAIANDTNDIEYAKINSSDEDDKIAFVTAYVYNSADDIIEETRYVVWEKLDTSLGFKKITTV